MTCDRQIYIYKGDDTDWNNEQLLTINVTAGSPTIDLSTMKAQFMLGSFSQSYSLTSGSFVVDLSAAVTGQYGYGLIYGSVKILDSENRVRTVANKIPFYVTDEVIDLQNQDLVIDLSDVSINITVGGTVNYNHLSNKPAINGLTIEGSQVAAYYNLAEKSALDAHIANISNPHQVTKQQIGLGNVNNTSDLNKPISTATQTALNAKQDNLTTAQLAAVNSGIDSVKVGQIETNRQNIADEITNRQTADNGLQTQIDALSAASDVTDIVGTYAELQTYDTDKLKDNDIIKVLEDSTHDNASSYYRWSTHTDTFTYIGSEGPYATPAQLQAGLNTKQDVISDLSTIRSGAAAGSTAVQPATAANTYLSKTDAASTYIPLTQKAEASGVATLDSNTLIPSAQLPAATTSTKGAVVMDEALNSTSVNPLQNKEVFTRLSLIAPFVQNVAVRDFNEQEVVDATDLLDATGDLHALNLDLSANHSLQKLTAKGTSGKIANVSSVLVSNKAPLDNATSPQIDVSYTGLNKAALVNLFNSMPYNVGYTTEGSPTITDGVASGFSDSNYLPISGFFTEEGDIDIVVELTTDDLTAQQYPFSWNCKPASANRHCGLYIIQDGKYGFLVRDTADNNYQYTAPSAYALSANTTYYLRLLFTAADKSLKMGASTDGVNYTYGINITLTANLCPINTSNNFRIGRANPSGYHFLGSVDLNETYIKVNGKPFFRGTAAVTKTVSVVGCTGTADLTAEDKAIAEDKGWAITLS